MLSFFKLKSFIFQKHITYNTFFEPLHNIIISEKVITKIKTITFKLVLNRLNLVLNKTLNCNQFYKQNVFTLTKSLSH